MKRGIILFLLIMFFCSKVSAQQKDINDFIEKPENNEAKMEIIADVGIVNAEISEIKKNHLKLVFDVENSMDLQAGVIYGLELIKKQGDESEFIADIQIFSDDKLIIKKNESIHREIEYRSPDYLDGEFILWLKIKNESGLLLAMKPFNVSLLGTNQFIQYSNPCYLTIGGEIDKKYNLRQGVDLKKEEKLFINCQAENLIDDSISVIPSFEFYQRDFFGPRVGEATEGEAITFNSRENKLVQMTVPLPKDPQAYDVKISLKKESETFSNPVIAHFVLAGKSASISQLTLEKDRYGIGEKVKLGIIWAGSADTFRDSRTGGSWLVDPIFEFEIRNSDGKFLCAPKMTKKPNEFGKTVEIVIEKECLYPIVTARIFDEGQLLAEKTINTDSRAKVERKPISQVNSSEKKSTAMAISFLVIMLVFASLIGVLIYKRRASQKVFLLLLFFSVFWGGSEAKAATSLLTGPAWLQAVWASWITETTFVPLSDCISNINTSVWPVCPANYEDLYKAGLLSYCKYPSGAGSLIYWYGERQGCYRDIVDFYYDIADKTLNSGETLEAIGSATGVNLCNNGVTATMSAAPNNLAPVYKQLFSYYFSDKGVPHGGFATWSTTGWNCGNYNSRFNFSFTHGGSNTPVSGNGLVAYSISNCCTPTCSTGPGCRSSLTNGVVSSTSGTCCSGSCYTCASGYYWNGSMCVADCAAKSWTSSLSAAPSSGPATLTVDLTANISSAFGGETYTYTNQSCGSGGPSPTNISGSTFRCTYPSAGTFNPSVRVTAQSNGCYETPSTSVTVNTAPVDGVCGTAARTYPSTATGWSPYTLCSAGSASPASPAFPAIGATTSWTCLGQNGGVNSPICSASRVAAPTLIFSASPASVNYDGSSTLSWTSTGADWCWGWSDNDYYSSSGWPSEGSSKLLSDNQVVYNMKNGEIFYLKCGNSSTNEEIQQDVTVSISYSCTGSDPANATLCSGDDTGLSAQTAKSVVSDCGDPKCEYKCNDGYSYIGGFCELPQPGDCGSADGGSFCSEPTNNLCDVGTPGSVTQATPTSWNWTCSGVSGGDSVSCSARKQCSWYETGN